MNTPSLAPPERPTPIAEQSAPPSRPAPCLHRSARIDHANSRAHRGIFAYICNDCGARFSVDSSD